MKKQAIAVAGLLLSLAVLGLGLTALTPPPADRGFTVTASFYPMYTAALQVVGDTAGVQVACLAAPTAGCLHDYQLSPDEMAALSRTDVLIVNGAGAEGFLEHALSAYASLRTVDTSAGVPLLEQCDEHEAHDGHSHSVNEHIWLSPERYYRQVEALRDGLCAADPANAAAYTKNAAAYLERIAAVKARMDALSLQTDGAVLFHDSVAYAADSLGLAVLATVPLGEDTALSAQELAHIAEAVRGKEVMLLYDSQYADSPLSLEAYAAATHRVVWDTAVTPKAGTHDRERWLAAMEENIRQMEEVTAP